MTRVYELARNLNMENKALLEKMSAMGIVVKSHMSSVDDEIIAQIKEDMLGKKPEAVIETRVKPTVIRRRKKQVEETSVSAEAVSNPEVLPEEAVAETPAKDTEAKQPASKKEPKKVADAPVAAESDTARKPAPEEKDQPAEVQPADSKEKPVKVSKTTRRFQRKTGEGF